MSMSKTVSREFVPNSNKIESVDSSSWTRIFHFYASVSTTFNVMYFNTKYLSHV